jgi:hypothetical protein
MGEGDLSDVSIEPELHATSDAVLATLDRLRTLELEKRDLPVGSPRLVELAKEIERLATSVLGASDAQVDLAKAATVGAKAGSIDPATTINEMGDPPRDIQTVLAEWRDTERHLGDALPGSPEAARLRAEIEMLREEYRRAHDAAARRTSGGE